MEYTGRGEDVSPEFLIHNLTNEAKTLAITLDDRKHPIFKSFNHWLIWNLPVQDHIPGGISIGATVASLHNAKQGLAYGRHRYAGPKPPRGKQHAYQFKVFALDCELSLKDNARRRDFLKAIESYILQEGQITGLFE